MADVHAPPSRSWRPTLLGAVLAALAGLASAHDTWFSASPAAAGQLQLALGTGNAFSLQEFTVGADHLARQGCASANGPARPMVVEGDTPTALLLSAQTAPGGLSCWTQSLPFEIELPPDKVRIHLDEIHAPATVRATWAAMQARGQPWRERYTKHARIEWSGAMPTTARPSGMDMAC